METDRPAVSGKHSLVIAVSSWQAYVEAEAKEQI
jgi:hypothetical protein